MEPIHWAMILMILGLALAVLEIFIPSGGIIGFLSVLSVITSVVLAFRHGAWTGLGFVGTAVLVIPAGLILALKWWPRTSMGRRILLKVPDGRELLPDSDKRRELKSLVGQIGQAKNLMLPSGPVLIQGRTVDALSEGMAIEVGQWVRVVEVRGTRVVVRPTDEPPQARADDPLSRPIDSLGLDPFDDPLA
jgi:membrane-bound ClpP family serine protease